MTELPTASEPPTTPEVALALRSIEAAKLADPEIAECLEAIGDLVRITGKPDTVFDWVANTLGREHLRALGERNGITLHVSRAADEEQPPRTFVIWSYDGKGLAVIPGAQPPAVTILQLREEIAQRDEDLQRITDFHASVTAGHVEGVDRTHAKAGN
ncbi:hypothetical protein ACUXZZ_20440 [Streptomyces graminifolii]|uniref:hypothetical protein n=1 Tax=Streptomyces graminifolii TaxID=1266771 RepID=UPI00405963E9